MPEATDQILTTKAAIDTIRILPIHILNKQETHTRKPRPNRVDTEPNHSRGLIVSLTKVVMKFRYLTAASRWE